MPSHGMLEDDSHWYQAMEEAVCLSHQHNSVTSLPFWLPYVDKTQSITGNKLALYGLLEPVHDQPELTSKDVLRETSYDIQAIRDYMAANGPRPTPDQQQTFIAITGMIGRDGKVPEDPSTGLIIMSCGQIVNSPDELLSKKQLPGQEHAHKSIDCILNDDEVVQYPIEFLNSIQTPLDLQAYNLILKVGAPIMLIRNIDAPRLCNGPRLIVKKLMQHVVQATVLTG
ncbi:ATP-dependent DNA helicase [Trichonephila inaurata madagascariensis]|uniref:ATP-dependent DNA helicase n=1 Tax=Trichonephila inaurata madagascariensis TaxID=2747483 RepID=A0A8X6XZ40_9ARAC|nr:ATP-dependent DNA helicase [Trichonephila inaurata madagascariensis]